MDSAPLEAFTVTPRRRKPRLSLVFLPLTLALAVGGFFLYQLARIVLVAGRRALRATFRPWFIVPFCLFWVIFSGINTRVNLVIFDNEWFAMDWLNRHTRHLLPPSRVVTWFFDHFATAQNHLENYQWDVRDAIGGLPVLIAIFALCWVAKFFVTLRDRGIRLIP